MKPEEEYRKRIDPTLEKYFNVEREVYSINGKRIDYILQCKQSGFMLGLEVKSLQHKRGVDIADFCKQAEEYTNELWNSQFTDQPSKVMIFIAPSISKIIKQINIEKEPIYQNRVKYFAAMHNESDHYHCNVDGFISSAFGVGCLKNYYNNNYFGFIFNNKIIWATNSYNREYFRKENYNLYAAKYGLTVY